MTISLKRYTLFSVMALALLGACSVKSRNENTVRPTEEKTTAAEPTATPVPVETPAPGPTPTPTPEGEPLPNEMELIKYDFKKGELTTACAKAIADTTKQIDAIAKLGPTNTNYQASLGTLEKVMADFGDTTTPLTFMGYVSVEDELRKESSACESDVSQFFVSIFTRKDLYDSIKSVVTAQTEELRLLSETKKSFEKNGLKLSEEKLAQVRELKQKLAALETKFSENLNNDTSSINFAEAELDGVSPDFLARLKKAADGKFIVTTKNTDYLHVMENAKNSETRRKMLLAYNNRASTTNPQLLEQAILIRQEIATLMGYATWADYRTDGRMAKDGKSVLNFLTNLRGKLSERNKADLGKLLAFKKELDPTATELKAHDIAYTAYQLKKRDYSLDEEKIREYFPSDLVVRGMFDVYSQILGVEYQQVVGAKVWHPDVKLYKVIDKKSQKVVSYFFADMIPRAGKYGHAAAFTLIQGRAKELGYNYPVSSIVSNFNPPSGEKPSLLSIDEVETLFHEFGHIMHQTLTRAPFASLSGTSVAQDFVEAPSQMLENWVWDAQILNKISGHYKNNAEKLPAELLKQVLAAKDFNQGYFYTRQLFLGLMDFTMHTAKGPVDTTKLHDLLYKEIIGVEPSEGGHFNAGFGHLMGGYDAGYYGYLWSEVYAADMFTEFKAKGLLDPTTGGRYRDIILAKGNLKEPLDLVREFLGREPNTAAFFEKLGITP